MFSSLYELRQHKKLVGHVRMKKKEIIQKITNQRSIVDFVQHPATDPQVVEDNTEEEDEEGEGHHCLEGLVEDKIDENMCAECMGKYGPDSGDWSQCIVCKCWFHDGCF